MTRLRSDRDVWTDVRDAAAIGVTARSRADALSADLEDRNAAEVKILDGNTKHSFLCEDAEHHCPDPNWHTAETP